MPRNVNVDVVDWESICIHRSTDPDDPGYVIRITYVLAGADVTVRKERRINSSQLSAGRQTALANLDADILARIKVTEGV